MNEIHTQRHPFKFYFLLILGGLFLAVLGTILLFSFQKEISENNTTPKTYIMGLVGLAIYVFDFLMLRQYFKNAPIYSLNDTGIFKKGFGYPWHDVKKLTLTGKHVFPFMLYHVLEAVAIEFKNGDRFLMYDEFYKNMPEVKKVLSMKILGEETLTEAYETNFSTYETSADFYETFKDNQFTSFRGIWAWGGPVFLFWMAIQGNKPIVLGAIIFVGIMSCVMFFGLSYSMHYFKVGHHFLLVKNHNLFWIFKTYHLQNIAEVVYETHGKSPNNLRIITTDFKSKLYGAGTLRDSTWLQMKDVLESRGIKVRNECI